MKLSIEEAGTDDGDGVRSDISIWANLAAAGDAVHPGLASTSRA
jgi:hypothetical protein